MSAVSCLLHTLLGSSDPLSIRDGQTVMNIDGFLILFSGFLDFVAKYLTFTWPLLYFPAIGGWVSVGFAGLAQQFVESGEPISHPITPSNHGPSIHALVFGVT